MVGKLHIAALLALGAVAAEPPSAGDASAPHKPPLAQDQAPGSAELVSWSGTATNVDGAPLARIAVDTSQAPELAEWGQRAGELCVEWYPKIATLLASEGFTPPHQVELRFLKDMRGVAATSRDVIRISANYVTGHTNDFGMVIHELTHVVQSYHHRGNPGWLVEGVADYVRLARFEPQARRPHINPDKASYRDSYKTTAIFLEWVEKSHDHQLVKELNRSMREGHFELDFFQDRTGKSVDELWAEFLHSIS